jgi:beta-galactosidase
MPVRRTSFNTDWEFRPHTSFFAELSGSAGAWEFVALPHDASIRETRDPGLRRQAGYFPGGVYDYRKTFWIPDDYADQCMVLEFEGVYRAAQIYVNGDLAGQWASGYTTFAVPLDNHLRYGAENEVRVVCRSHDDSRWYAGAGIHRPVHLLVGPPAHVARNGVRVTTCELDADFVVVEIATTVQNSGRGVAIMHVSTNISSDAGSVVASAVSPVTVLPGDSAIVRQRVVVASPSTWSPDAPALYRAFVALSDGGEEVVDDEMVTFGIRTIQVDSMRGLRINGEPVKLRGACVHSDNGVLGSATIGRADERRVELLKAAGFNALRSAHNPMSVAMLDACDRLGVLVMDELTDTWTESKSSFDGSLDFPLWWERDIEAMIDKDFNHPSVIFYSIGNEIPELGRPRGAVWSRRLAEKVRAHDRTRLVTNSVNAMLAVMAEARASEESSTGGINTMLSDLSEFMEQLAASDLVTSWTSQG